MDPTVWHYFWPILEDILPGALAGLALIWLLWRFRPTRPRYRRM